MIVSLRNGFQQKFLLDVVTQVVDLFNGLNAVYVDVVHVLKVVNVVKSDDVAHMLLLLIVWCC